jgi:Flp pilus assembly protein TadG
MTFSHPRRSRNKQTRRGVAALEMAVTAPFVLMLLLGIWEVGRIVEISQILNNAAREGARQAASGSLTNDQVAIAVCNYLFNAGLKDYTSTRSSVVSVVNLTENGVDASAAAQLDKLQVSVTIPYQDVRWTSLSLITNSSTKLYGSALWFSLQDQNYPNSVSVPPGY